jgi:ferric-dicitrate binding protein FerR (iron transport regulator)
MLPLLAVSILFFLQDEESEKVAMTKMTTPPGIQSQIELPDGSHVWLNSESEIYFPSTFKGQERREIELTGEGYFEVVSNSKKPFIVSVGNELNVKVTGTCFNISAYKNEPEVSVALVKGGVTIQKEKDGTGRLLAKMKPGEVAKFDKEHHEISVAGDKDLESYISWKDGKFIFVNEPFESVLRRMERKYNVKYKIEDSQLLKYRITATFLDETLEEFLRIITVSSPIKYEISRAKQKGGNNVLGKREVTLRRRK